MGVTKVKLKVTRGLKCLEVQSGNETRVTYE